MFTRGGNRELRRLGWGLHAAGLAALALGALAAREMAFQPLAERSRCNADQSQRLARLLRRGPAIRREHAELLRTLKEMEERTEAVRRRVPSEAGEAQYLRELTQVAQREHVRIQNLQVGAATRRDNHSQLSLQISLAGAYEGLCGFFDGLARIPRAACIESFDLRAPPDETVYPVKLTLTLYFGMRDPSPAAGAAPHGST